MLEGEVPEEGVEESVSETASLPLSMLGGKAATAGDVVRLEVVDVDEDNGLLTVRYATETEDKPKALGVDAMAAAFE